MPPIGFHSRYSIDPRGLTGMVSAGLQVDQTEFKTHLQKTQSSLRALAEGTGGLAVVNDNDFGVAAIDSRGRVVRSGNAPRLVVIRVPEPLQ